MTTLTEHKKPIKNLILTLILTITLGIASTATAQAQSSPDAYTVGLWHFDEIKPDGYRQITPDATGINHGTLGPEPPPALVEGKFDKALEFDGSNFVYVPIAFLVGFPPSPEPIFIPISPSLDITNEIKLEAWISVQGFTDAEYNNIIVKCTRADAQWKNITRITGIAVRASEPDKGVLSGFVFTDTDGFNEIVTTEPVITLKQWTHVAFTRTASGMHLYVNGYEKTVTAIHGVQNPEGAILNGSEIYFGHDAKVIIDEARISNLAPETLTAAAQIDIGPNLLIAIIVVAVVFAVAWLLRRAVQMWMIHSKA
ncbi:MAG: LamG domain-containing protein [Candidatus Bathyarchaeota archaeon]|nr:LamG domain-containing protein [Candidatus Bathyarchaeota archaeon]